MGMRLPSLKRGARRYIEELSKIVSFADVLSGDIKTAFNSDVEDFEDAVVDAVAARNGSSFMLTSNVRDFAASVIKAITPGTFCS